MADFNTVCSELVKHLQLTGQATDGRIFWYEGTIPLLFEMISFLMSDETVTPKTNADRIRSMTDEELARFMSKVETNGRVFGLKGIASWLKWLRQEADG